MSEADRRKWDERYRQGAYSARPWPSAFLADCAELLPTEGRALDLACGAGRNALFLAERGLSVDAVDISAEALARGKAASGDLAIRWLRQDLDDGFDAPCRYDVIVNIRYVNPRLVRRLLPALRDGGVLIVEQHLKTAEEGVIGPTNAAYRVAPGDLVRLAHGLALARCEEGLFVDPDGGKAALARLAGRKIQPPSRLTAS